MQKPMDDGYKLYIDGQWVEASTGKNTSTYCPANGELLSLLELAKLLDQVLPPVGQANHEIGSPL